MLKNFFARKPTAPSALPNFDAIDDYIYAEKHKVTLFDIQVLESDVEIVEFLLSEVYEAVLTRDGNAVGKVVYDSVVIIGDFEEVETAASKVKALHEIRGEETRKRVIREIAELGL